MSGVKYQRVSFLFISFIIIMIDGCKSGGSHKDTTVVTYDTSYYVEDTVSGSTIFIKGKDTVVRDEGIDPALNGN